LHQPEKKFVSAHKLALLGMMLLGPLAACGEPVEPVEPEIDAPMTPSSPTCGDDGAATASLYGAIETQILWSADDMTCDSMHRPNGQGVRLQIVGNVSGERLAIIISLPSLNRGDTAVEIPSNVTATVEGSGRFFSTPNLDSCWTEVNSNTKLADEGDTYALKGTLFCIAPLGEINGDAAVSIPEFSFSTILNWSGK
jgi:hypothetical protein